VIKDFDQWNEVKKKLHKKPIPLFSQQQIWWCSIGLNVGVEIDGKGIKFERPVVIFKKINRYSFIGLPMTTKIDNKPNAHLFDYNLKNGTNGAIITNQLKYMSAFRLDRRLGMIGDKIFADLKEKVLNQF
jgi:mRNA interferase MazF